MPASVEGAPSTFLRQRLDTAVSVARAHGTTLPMDRLFELLPAGAPHSLPELARFVREQPGLGDVVEEEFVPRGVGAGLAFLEERRARGRAYRAAAEELWTSALPAVRPLTRALLVTGSAAYGEPDRGDDLDFFAITRSHAAWAFLALTFLVLRLRAWRGAGARTVPYCFNLVLDDRRARREFGRPRGFLFAREALMSCPVAGEEYYRGLVAESGWMREELPRLYGRWEARPAARRQEPDPTPWPVRLLDMAAFPILATYLQLAGLVRNHRFRREGRPERGFRTRTSLSGLSLETTRFERLRSIYEPGPAAPRGTVP